MRKSIPAPIRFKVWRTYIGTSLDGKCYCCNNYMSIENWQAGHVVAYADGGPETVENLRPICGQCNTSMGKVNMHEFAKHYDMPGNIRTEYTKSKNSIYFLFLFVPIIITIYYLYEKEPEVKYWYFF